MNKKSTLSEKETQRKTVTGAGVPGIRAAHRLKEACGEHCFPLLKMQATGSGEKRAQEIFSLIPRRETEYEGNQPSRRA